MLKSQFSALVDQVRSTLQSGQAIVIVGWMDKNHNAFTRSITDKKVLFVEKKDARIGRSCGLILFTKYLKHSDHEKLRSQHKDKAYKIVLEIHQIRSMLKLCKDLLSPEEKRKSTRKTTTDADAPAEAIDDQVLDFITQPRRHNMDEFDRFAESFMEEVKRSRKEGCVSSKIINKLRAKAGVESTVHQLISGSWVVGVVADGNSRIGWYKPGAALLERLKHEKLEPENPYERALMIIQKKPMLLEQLAEIEKELKRIEVAERVIAELKELDSQ